MSALIAVKGWENVEGKHTTEIANLLNEGKVRSPEMLGRQERRAASGPAHLLREKGAWGVGADARRQAERHVLDLPAAVNSTETASG